MLYAKELKGINAPKLETKDFVITLETKAFEEKDGYFFFKGYGAIFNNVDLGDDVILKGAFAKSLAERMPKLCYQHDYRDPIGVLIKCNEDDKGLYFEGKMPLENQHCKDIISLIKCGAIDSMSIGYCTNEFELQGKVRYLKEVRLYEISPVTFPMNEGARIDLKSIVPYQDLPMAGEDVAWDSVKAVKRMREFCEAVDAPNKKYMKGFLWYNEKDMENFGSYKLPIADVVDGKMQAIPRGIFAAAAALQGARGGIDLPDDVIEEIKGNVSKYYKKMELIAPWDVDDDKAQEIIDKLSSIKDVHSFLRSKGLSNIERTGIIAKIKAVSADTRKENADADVLSNSEYGKALVDTVKGLRAVVSNLK